MSNRGEADEAIRRAVVDILGELFATLGRALICLNENFEIVHASEDLDALVGAGTAKRIDGLAAENCLGSDLFGPAAILRRALESGERREGLGASMTSANGSRVPLSIDAAPVGRVDSPILDPRVAYLLIVRGAEHANRPDTAREPRTIPRPGNGAEARRLRMALDSHGWSREATARALGVSRTTLWRRMRELGLTRRRTGS